MSEAIKRGKGRPPGSKSKLSHAAIENAKRGGILPHEWMLDVMRGVPILMKKVDPETGETVGLRYEVADLPMRMDAAKSSANYFASKLSTIEWTQGVGDDELDEIIAQLATETGISLGTGGEGEEDESEDEESAAPRKRVRVDP